MARVGRAVLSLAVAAAARGASAEGAGAAPTPAPVGADAAPLPPPPTPSLRAGAATSGGGGGVYTMDWEAKGHSFFDDWTFSTFEPNHGAAHFLGSFREAKAAGVAEAYGSNAILRAGGRSTYKHKRMSGKIITNRSWTHFLAAMRYNHVPYGCGVWPAFYSLGVGEWPMAGEMNILEYVNDAGGMTSFHTGRSCQLSPDEVNKYKPMPDANRAYNGGVNYECWTKYCDTCKSLGCAPNTLPLRTGRWWANRPGVVAMERTAEFAKIFYIPEGEIPDDLRADRPNPKAWDRWIISYYPFADSPGCPDPDAVMTAQKFLLQINFCGDWASKVWGQSHWCTRQGPTYNATATEAQVPPPPHQCRAVDPLAEYAPQEDCCTRYIADDSGEFSAEASLRQTAFFDIAWFKVFTGGA